jgi:hypothetical protein
MGAKLSFDDLPGQKGGSGQWRNGSDWKLGTVFVTKVAGPVTALVYTCGVNIDFDGSPTAYGPPSKPGDDDLAHAGPGRGTWFGVFPMTAERAKEIRDEEEKKKKKKSDPSFTAIRPTVDEDAQKDSKGQQPCVQQKGEPSPGHYVSSSAATFNGAFPEWHQNHWWDASRFPYGALSGGLMDVGGVALHDFGLAIRLDRPAQALLLAFEVETRRLGPGQGGLHGRGFSGFT